MKLLTLCDIHIKTRTQKLKVITPLGGAIKTFRATCYFSCDMALFHKDVYFKAFGWTMIYLSVISQVTNSQTDFDKDPILNYASLEKPFRMQKCNIAWDKARTKPLQESKLKLLYYELKLQDKEEIALKKLKSEMGDKDGLRLSLIHI